MNIIADVSVRTSRSALLLFSSLALLAGPALAQTTPPPTTAVPVSANTVASVAGPSAPAGAQPATVAVAPPVLPTTTVVLPPSSLAPSGNTLHSPEVGETAVTLDIAYGIRAVAPSRLTVPVGETLLITGPSPGGRSVQWMKDGRPLDGATQQLLALHGVLSSDAGIYQLVATDAKGATFPSQLLVLGVGPTDRLQNLSTRGLLAAGVGQNLTSGFVVVAGAAQTKKLILRAVGPSLAAFGVTNPLRAPVLRVYDSAGNLYTNGYVYTPVIGGLTYESDLANSLAQTGAFPIPAGTLDAVVMMPFLPGSYTAQVTSGDNTAGAVLLEIYEVP